MTSLPYIHNISITANFDTVLLCDVTVLKGKAQRMLAQCHDISLMSTVLLYIVKEPACDIVYCSTYYDDDYNNVVDVLNSIAHTL